MHKLNPPPLRQKIFAKVLEVGPSHPHVMQRKFRSKFNVKISKILDYLVPACLVASARSFFTHKLKNTEVQLFHTLFVFFEYTAK